MVFGNVKYAKNVTEICLKRAKRGLKWLRVQQRPKKEQGGANIGTNRDQTPGKAEAR